MSNIGTYLLDCSEKYLTFLKDFYQNIINLSQKFMDENEFIFYFKNQKKINQLVGYKSQVKKHIKSEITKAGSLIEGVREENLRVNHERQDTSRYLNSIKNNGLSIKITFKDLLLNEKKFRISIEFRGAAFRDQKKLKSLITTENYSNLEFNTYEKKHFIEFAKRDYELNEDNDIYNLSEFIKNKINWDGFLEIFKKLDKELENK